MPRISDDGLLVDYNESGLLHMQEVLRIFDGGRHRWRVESAPHHLVVLKPQLADPVARRLARWIAVKNSWFTYLAVRCKGVSNSAVQIPCRSGSPQGAFSAAPEAAIAVANAPAAHRSATPAPHGLKVLRTERVAYSTT
jgi:hypothetical protein